MSPTRKKRAAKKASPRKKLAKRPAKKRAVAKKPAAKRKSVKSSPKKAVKKVVKSAAKKAAPKPRPAPEATSSAAERKSAARAPQRRDIVPEVQSDKHRLENESNETILGVEEFEEEEEFDEGYGDEEDEYPSEENEEDF